MRGCLRGFKRLTNIPCVVSPSFCLRVVSQDRASSYSLRATPACLLPCSPTPALCLFRVTETSHHVASIGLQLTQDSKCMPPLLAGLSFRVMQAQGTHFRTWVESFEIRTVRSMRPDLLSLPPRPLVDAAPWSTYL